MSKLKDITLLVPFKLTRERIEDLLCNAWEGGSAYWCSARITRRGEDVTYVHEHATRGGEIEIYDPEDPDEVPLGVLNADTIRRGVGLLGDHPGHLADIVAENDDAETGDVFLQLCVMGEVVYG